jgi:hypothetical protein
MPKLGPRPEPLRDFSRAYFHLLRFMLADLPARVCLHLYLHFFYHRMCGRFREVFRLITPEGIAEHDQNLKKCIRLVEARAVTLLPCPKPLKEYFHAKSTPSANGKPDPRKPAPPAPGPDARPSL